MFEHSNFKSIPEAFACKPQGGVLMGWVAPWLCNQLVARVLCIATIAVAIAAIAVVAAVVAPAVATTAPNNIDLMIWSSKSCSEASANFSPWQWAVAAMYLMCPPPPGSVVLFPLPPLSLLIRSATTPTHWRSRGLRLQGGGAGGVRLRGETCRRLDEAQVRRHRRSEVSNGQHTRGLREVDPAHEA